MWQIQNPQTPLGLVILTAIVLGAFLIMLGLIPVLQTLPPRGRRALIAVVTFLAGLFFAAEFFLPVDEKGKNFFTDQTVSAQQMLQVIGALALGLGIYGLIRLHLRNVVQRRAQWGYSVVLILSFIVMAIFSVANSLAEQGLVEKRETLLRGYELLFEYTLVPLDATMFSLIAFYIFSAAYRAFRIRSIEAGILMFTAIVVMLGVVPLGAYISERLFALPKQWWNLPADFGLPSAANWILIRLNSPVQRAIEFGIGIGGLAMAIRLWLSLERGIN